MRHGTSLALPCQAIHAIIAKHYLHGAAGEKSGDIFRVGVFLDFVRLTTRVPHGAHVRGAKRNRIGRRSRIILPLFFQAGEKGSKTKRKWGLYVP